MLDDKGRNVKEAKPSSAVSILGLSDVIVDIVETGKTLLENDLEPKETIVPISARLVANKVSYKFKNEEISELCDKVCELIAKEK